MELNANSAAEQQQGVLEPYRKQGKPDLIAHLDIRDTITRLIVRIDQILNQTINKILHHPEFQKLESDWRAIDYLCRESALCQ